ncbi:hypothetical protein LUW77_13320 [Streptomyces radiopugnans]|nr:hypothetical protein LUW77_13320 [Streptomyces radiopugnans]
MLFRTGEMSTAAARAREPWRAWVTGSRATKSLTFCIAFVFAGTWALVWVQSFRPPGSRSTLRTMYSRLDSRCVAAESRSAVASGLAHADSAALRRRDSMICS